jgi:hypothetical protein
MSINYESTPIAEVRMVQVTAAPGIGVAVLRFTLAWTLHPKREKAYSIFGTYLRITAATSSSPQALFLGHAVPEVAFCDEALDGIPIERRLMYLLTLQSDQFLALEQLRQGHGLLFGIEVRGNALGSYGVRQVNETLQHEVSVSDWIPLLRDANAGDILLVGVNLPTAAQNPNITAAIEFVRRAHVHLLRGEYDGAVGECRRALESVWKLGKLSDAARNARKALSTMDDRKSMNKQDRALALGEALINFTHPAHHVEKDGAPEIFSRLDAALAVASTGALISTLAVSMASGNANPE